MAGLRFLASVPRRWLIACGLVATIVAGFSAVLLGAAPPVPNVVGMTETKAVTTVEDAGFEVGDTKREFSDQPAGVVLSQTPFANAEAPKGATVTLVVSMGPEIVDVPTLIGRSEAEALELIQKAGLAADVLPPEFSEEFDPGQVIRQTPSPGEGVALGGTVSFVTASGSTTPTAGIGRRPGSKDATVTAARPRGATAGENGASTSPYTQQPTRPSNGVNVVRVPNVIRTSRISAEDTLLRAGLTVIVSEEFSSSVPAGTVSIQSPAAGTQIRWGSTVTITVSKGPEQVRVPNVLGMSEARAKAELVEAGLRALAVYQLREGTGDVTEQSYRAGTVLDRHTVVTITVDGR